MRHQAKIPCGTRDRQQNKEQRQESKTTTSATDDAKTDPRHDLSGQLFLQCLRKNEPATSATLMAHIKCS